MKTGIELIAKERSEQIEKHGFKAEDETQHYQSNELIDAAMYCLMEDDDLYPRSWGFWFHDNMRKKEERMSEQEFTIERLKIAGALIAAEIDRILQSTNSLSVEE